MASLLPMKYKIPILGISGVATAGKDTVYTLIKKYLNDDSIKRIAFADALKEELDPFFKSFGGTAWETDPIKKAKIRPILVSHGCSMRDISNGQYWIKKIEPRVLEWIEKNNLVIITDVRFINELHWIREHTGKVIYVERIQKDGSVLKPTNNEEIQNDPDMRNNSDLILSLNTVENPDSLLPSIGNALKLLDFVDTQTLTDS